MSNASSKPVVPWSPFGGALFVLVTFFVSQFVAVALTLLLQAGYTALTKHQVADLDHSIVGQFIFMVFAECISIAAILRFVAHYKVSLETIGLRRPIPRDILYGLAAVPIYYVIYIFTVGVVSSLVTGLDVDQKQQIGFDNVHGVLPLVMTFISLVVLPPLAEEIMVRGLLFTSLKKAFPLIPAAIVTSLIFAAAHLPEGGAAGPLYIAALDTFVLSLILIYLRQRTGSLWSSITLHACKNGVVFIALFVIQSH